MTGRAKRVPVMVLETMKAGKMADKSMKAAGLGLFFLAVLCGPVQAGDALKVDWEQLIPKKNRPVDPVSLLTEDQKVAFENIKYWRSLTRAEKAAMSPNDLKDINEVYKQSLQLMKRTGVSVTRIFSRYNDWQKKIAKLDGTTVKKFNGRKISIAGYLLPLDFSKKGVTDFLLVPYVGACIHVPPPPVNQTVFVRMNRRYKAEGLFDPVWVTGRFNDQHTQKNLSLVDGVGTVGSGYTISGQNITTYTPAPSQ